MNNRTTVSLHNDVIDPVLAIKPGRKSLTAFLEDLIEQHLHGVSTLNVPSRQAPGPTKGGGHLNKEEEERARENFVPKTILKEEINRNPDRVVPGAGDPFRLKSITADLVPEDLAASADLFCEWWSVRNKGAVRSKKVADREFTKLREFKPADRANYLQKAIAGGWKQLYKPDELKSRNTPQEAPSNHPAHKVFKADDLGPEWDVPSVTGGKGVLEGMF